ncbi:MAG TPA: hypothetical protein VH139_02820 [Acidobacteriaceae bacterium]|jgi:hypothetical protein|nr:hypothetical protein [Acidobacteriaceae bacterium]
MEPEIAMHAVIDSLHTYLDKLLNSPHHLIAYIAGAAVLLVCIPLVRALFGSRSRQDKDDDAQVSASSPSMLGLSSPVMNPVMEFEAGPLERKGPSSATAGLSNVTAINAALTVPCIHCGVIMPSREDFCPACGYAQPVKQSFIAAFPA